LIHLNGASRTRYLRKKMENMPESDPNETCIPPDRGGRNDDDSDKASAERAVEEQKRQEETGQESPVA
jgi:hypothetical protein